MKHNDSRKGNLEDFCSQIGLKQILND